MKVITLSGYACNGKSSLIPALEWELSKTGKKVITLSEPVSIPISINEILNDEDKLLCNYQIQTPILSSSIHQLEFIRELNKINYDGYVITDRSIYDVLVFSAIKQIKYKNKNKKWAKGWLFGLVLDVYSMLMDYDLHLYIPQNVVFINIPSNIDVIRECFERKERKETITYNSFFEDATIFKDLFIYLVDLFRDELEFNIKYKEFISPSDNSYVLYKMLNWITK